MADSKDREQGMAERPPQVPNRSAGPVAQGGDAMSDSAVSTSQLVPLPFAIDLSPSDDQLRRFAEQSSKLLNSSNMQFEIVHGITDLDESEVVS
jgi:hypothetical protein